MLKGRVKTLHPRVHGGILSTNSESDEKDLAEQSIDKIDIVVVNLYPCSSYSLAHFTPVQAN